MREEVGPALAGMVRLGSRPGVASPGRPRARGDDPIDIRLANALRLSAPARWRCPHGMLIPMRKKASARACGDGARLRSTALLLRKWSFDPRTGRDR